MHRKVGLSLVAALACGALSLAAPARADVTDKVREILTQLVEKGPDLVGGLGGHLGPFVSHLPGIRDLQEKLRELVGPVGEAFREAARDCPGKLARMGPIPLPGGPPSKKSVDETIRCFVDAVGKALATAAAKLREALVALVRAVTQGEAAVTKLFAPLRKLPGMEKVENVVRQAAKAGAEAFVPLGVSCAAKLGDLKPGTVAAVATCLADAAAKAAKTSTRTAVSAIVDQARAVLRKVIEEAPKGKEAVERALGPLANHSLPGLDALRRAIFDALAAGGKTFAERAAACPAKLTSILPAAVAETAACFAKATAAAAVQGASALAGPLKQCFPKLDLKTVLGMLNPANLLGAGGLQGLLRAIVANAEAGFDGVRCLLQAILPKDLAGDLPTFAELKDSFLRVVQDAGAFFKDPKAFFTKVRDEVVADVTELVPWLLDWFMRVRNDFRELRLADSSSLSATLNPFAPTEHDAKFKKFGEQLLEPLFKILDKTLGRFAPPSLGRFVKKVVTAPAQLFSLVFFRVLLIGNTAYMKFAKVIVPGLLKGAAVALEALDRIRVPPWVKEFALAAFDSLQEVFGGVGAAALETLGLKDVVESVLGSVVGAFDEVRGVVGKMRNLGGAKSAAQLLAVFEEAGAPATEESRRAALATAKKAHGEAGTALEAATKAVNQAERVLLDTENRNPGRGAVDAARERLDQAKVAARRAVEREKTAAADVARVDPAQVGEQVIGVVWETLSEAMVKLGFDVPITLVQKLNSLYIDFIRFVYDVYFAVGAAVLGVIPYTTDYGPLIVTAVGYAWNVFVGLLSGATQMLNAVVTPEIRTFLKDDIVNHKKIFVSMWRDPQQRATLQRANKVFASLVEKAGPIAERLRKVQETVKLGAAGLMSGPLGKIFSVLPRGLWAAISRAIQKSGELLKEVAVGAAVALTKLALSKGKSGQAPKIDVKLLVKSIVVSVKDPIIEFLTAFIPTEDAFGEKLALGIKNGLIAASSTAIAKFESRPASLLDPKEILGIIADGLLAKGAPEALAAFLVRPFEGAMPSGVATALEESVSRAVQKVLPLVRDLRKVTELLRGGMLGIFREVLYVVEPALTKLLLTALVPPDPSTQESFGRSFKKAFELVLKPGELERTVRGGIPAVAAKILELSYEPVSELFLLGFPDGSLKEAIRAATRVAGRKASEPPFFRKLSAQGLVVLFGEVLAAEPVADAVSSLLTSELNDTTLKNEVAAGLSNLGKRIAEGGPLKASVLKDGIRAVLNELGKPVAQFFVRKLTEGLQLPPSLASALPRVVDQAFAALTKPAPGVSLQSMPRLILERLRKFFEKVLAKARADRSGQQEVAERIVAVLRGGGTPLGLLAQMRERLAELRGRLLPEVKAEEVTP